MRVIFHPPIASRIHEALYKAGRECKTIDRIELTPEEFRELSDYARQFTIHIGPKAAWTAPKEMLFAGVKVVECPH